MHRPATRRAAPVPPSPGALAQYRRRASTYDVELAPFETYRADAIAKLQLAAGETVLDVGCGTGLSFERLRAGVGASGRIVGIEQSPEMLARARERVVRSGWENVDLVEAPAAGAQVPQPADAALFHFTHDVMRDEASLANVFAHLKPGARVVACGLQWAPGWMLPANGFVLLAALYSTSSLEGLDKPWDRLARFVTDLQVESVLQGSIYIAAARVPDRVR
jgi:SAM-dependent methyltransferase